MGIKQKPLSGWRVVEFSHFIAAPSVGQALLDLGAKVIKVENPAGDPTRPTTGSVASSIFETFNHGKKSVVLDLNDPEDEEIAQRLALGADIVIHNISASSMERHGLGGKQLREQNPALIYGSIRGFPSNTSRAHDKGFDGIGQAETGMIWVNGTEESGPLKLPYNPVDVATGDSLLQGILAAIIRRLQTGEGTEVETSLFEGGLHAQTYYWGLFLQGGENPGRIGNREPAVAPAAEIHEVTDGYVIFSAYLPKHWEALCTVLDVPELITDPLFETNDRRLANQDALWKRLQSALDRKGWTVEQAGEAFDSIKIANGQVSSYQDIYDRGLLQESGQLAQIREDNRDPYYVFNAPYRFVGTDRPATAEVPPKLGAHTDEVITSVTAGDWELDTRKVS